MKILVEVKFKRGGKRRFLIVKQKGFFGGEKWVVAEPGFWGPKKIGEAPSYEGALSVIAMRYGDIKDVRVLKQA